MSSAFGAESNSSDTDADASDFTIGTGFARLLRNGQAITFDNFKVKSAGRGRKSRGGAY